MLLLWHRAVDVRASCIRFITAEPAPCSRECSEHSHTHTDLPFLRCTVRPGIATAAELELDGGADTVGAGGTIDSSDRADNPWGPCPPAGLADLGLLVGSITASSESVSRRRW